MISQPRDSTLKGRTTNILKPKTNRRVGESRKGTGIPIESIVISLVTVLLMQGPIPYHSFGKVGDTAPYLHSSGSWK